ncbi:isopentenyl-diphosphate Delta-isomerase [Rhodococcus sp. NPDC058521]|uniref:isopentenyl-diphosphate Delta-isomerase n=1 Tax=Rhodococcus sp. NPDC058521 TaxID=3346536 RepID=UPI00365E882D
MTAAEQVVLVNNAGEPIGTAPKYSVHGTNTPLHLAFSCYVIGQDDRILLTQRSFEKATWPGVWTNSCCGHPKPGEFIGEAMLRRLDEELGLVPSDYGMVLPDFRYRSVMDNGIVENEICPVFVAYVNSEPTPNPMEVNAHAWLEWASLKTLYGGRALTLSPWSSLQIDCLTAFSDSPRDWPQLGPTELPPRWRRALGRDTDF